MELPPSFYNDIDYYLEVEMAITEKTKQVVANLRAQREAQIAAIERNIAEYESTIDTLKAQSARLKAEYDALKKDIPEPTPVEPK